MDPGGRTNAGFPRIAAAALSLAILLNLLVHDAGTFAGNMAAAARFLTSVQFLYLAAGSAILLRPALTSRQFLAGIFALSAFYFAHTYWRFLGILGMAGDNICQIAYFNILTRPELTGSIGASYPKPGQMLLLGLVNRLSAAGGEWVFKLFISLAMSACVTTLAAVSAGFATRTAGIATFLVAIWAFLPEFISGNYPIYLIPALFGGILLYFGPPARRSAGRLLLASTLLFHIQAIGVLAILWLVLLARKDWRELARFTRDCLLSLAIWAAVIYRVQGAFSRFNAGSAAGYLASGPAGDAAGLVGRLLDLIHGIAAQVAGNPHHMLPAVLLLVGIAGVVARGSWVWLSVLAGSAVPDIHVLFLRGELILSRHAAILSAFGCALGIGAIARFAGSAGAGWRSPARAGIAAAACLLAPLADFRTLGTADTLRSQYGEGPIVRVYVEDARLLLKDPELPRAARLMTEDDLLYPVVVLAPDRFGRLSALQEFNVQPESRRRRMLEDADRIWISLNGFHPYYYLAYLASPDWADDPFRRMVLRILETRMPERLYGFRFTPVDANPVRLLLEVAPDPDAAPGPGDVRAR
jgi:hypothetical protein